MFCVHAGIFVTQLIQLGLESHKLEGEQEGILTNFCLGLLPLYAQEIYVSHVFQKNAINNVFVFFLFFSLLNTLSLL